MLQERSKHPTATTTNADSSKNSVSTVQHKISKSNERKRSKEGLPTEGADIVHQIKILLAKELLIIIIKKKSKEINLLLLLLFPEER